MDLKWVYLLVITLSFTIGQESLVEYGKEDLLNDWCSACNSLNNLSFVPLGSPIVMINSKNIPIMFYLKDIYMGVVEIVLGTCSDPLCSSMLFTVMDTSTQEQGAPVFER
jgi:hypothetical protein